MKNRLKIICLCALVCIIAGGACGFSLLGPFDEWQTAGLNYNPGVVTVDIGGPMNLGDEYRWNIKTIYVGIHPSFAAYFGAKGTQAVVEAMAMLNAIPPVSKMSADLSEFPTYTRHVNYRAQALGLLDLKSYALGGLVEAFGLACPERYVWTPRLREAFPAFTNYWVIMRNFDPVTWAPSKYVNGVLYTYVVRELPWNAFDAIEIRVDPVNPMYTTVASIVGAFWGASLDVGEFVTGLTRDDVGAIRYLLSPSNYNIESLPTNLTAAFGPWSPYVGTNVMTNVYVNVALRPGVDKIEFKLAQYDARFGYFIPITNVYEDKYVTNWTLRSQNVGRVLLEPDIIFTVDDLGPGVVGARGVTFQNNSALYPTVGTGAGPGQIVPSVIITFNNLGPYYLNQFPGYMDEANPAGISWVWGYFDGSTNPPVVFPSGLTIQELEQRALSRP